VRLCLSFGVPPSLILYLWAFVTSLSFALSPTVQERDIIDWRLQAVGIEKISSRISSWWVQKDYAYPLSVLKIP
jgi:hypothetical protein